MTITTSIARMTARIITTKTMATATATMTTIAITVARTIIYI